MTLLLKSSVTELLNKFSKCLNVYDLMKQDAFGLIFKLIHGLNLPVFTECTAAGDIIKRKRL